MIKGFILTYKAKDSYSRTMLNHMLFGRLIYGNKRGKKIAYYTPGLLDNIPFSRIMNSKIFIAGEVFKDCLDTINTFGKSELKKSEREEKLLKLLTGKEYWQNIANERGFKFYVCRTKQKYT